MLSILSGRHEVWATEFFGTITTKSKIISALLKRFLTGADLMMIQGWPLDVLTALLENPQIKDNHLRMIAGNSFELGAFVSVLLSVLTHFPRLSPEQTPRNHEGAGEDTSLDALQQMFLA